MKSYLMTHKKQSRHCLKMPIFSYVRRSFWCDPKHGKFNEAACCVSHLGELIPGISWGPWTAYVKCTLPHTACIFLKSATACFSSSCLFLRSSSVASWDTSRPSMWGVCSVKPSDWCFCLSLGWGCTGGLAMVLAYSKAYRRRKREINVCWCTH